MCPYPPCQVAIRTNCSTPPPSLPSQVRRRSRACPRRFQAGPVTPGLLDRHLMGQGVQPAAAESLTKCDEFARYLLRNLRNYLRVKSMDMSACGFRGLGTPGGSWAVDVFETVLRGSVDRAQHALLLARQGEQQGEEYQHVVRLLDLLDRAQVNHVDTTSWWRRRYWRCCGHRRVRARDTVVFCVVVCLVVGALFDGVGGGDLGVVSGPRSSGAGPCSRSVGGRVKVGA